MINNYVDSGVEWLQDIPSHWGVKTIKRLFTESNTKNTDGNTNYLSIVKDKGVVLYSDKGNVGNKTSDHPEKYKMVEVDDIVINPMNIIIGSVGRSKYEGCLSSVYIVLKPNKGISGNYYEYIFSHKLFQKYLKRICYGIMELRESLNKIEFYVEKLPVPPIQEQQQISDYLDYKTLKIGTLIEKTQQKIELLKEQRTSLINTTVTKGLNPNVEMKDSGVEWIGEIPSGWELKPLKYFSEITLGKMLTPKDPGGYVLKPYLRSKNVQSEIPDITDVREMWFSEKDLKKYKLNREDLLVNEGGDAGRTTIWNNELSEVYIQNSVNRVKIVKGVSRYYLYQFTLNHVTGYFDSIVSRVSIPHLTKDKLERVKFICPSRQEQQQIVDYLDKETLKIDKLIDIESRRIDLLKEYRQSLISDVVTGKVDVRNGVLV